MPTLPPDISFERWVQYVFDHPVLDPQWWFRMDEPEYEEWPELEDPSRTLAYLTRLFSAPRFLINRYTRAQIDQGLNYLVSSSCSEYMFVLMDKTLPWPDRRACIDAMAVLYSDLMAPVYGNDIASGSRDYGPDRPNFACYMWWDIIPVYGGMDDPEREPINDAVMGVFARTLELKSEACLESVLHGLGHWHTYRPQQVQNLVNQFLAQRSDISAELRAYARRAAVGAVQ